MRKQPVSQRSGSQAEGKQDTLKKEMATHTTCGWLAVLLARHVHDSGLGASNTQDPTAPKLDELYQMIHVFISQPGPGATILIGSPPHLFFQTQITDNTGTTLVAVREQAALQLIDRARRRWRL